MAVLLILAPATLILSTFFVVESTLSISHSQDVLAFVSKCVIFTPHSGETIHGVVSKIPLSCRWPDG